MRNKSVGFLIVGISVFIFLIVLIFNSALKNIVGATCSHGPTCSMFDTIAVQTWISLAIAVLVLFIGIFLIFSKEEKEIVIKTVVEKSKHRAISMVGLDEIEKKAVSLLRKEEGMFQKTLMEELGVGKVKMTRMLDKLEAKQIVERKRRGMNNFVVLKK
ncbi:hypothetical protein HN747_00755 [archaeon]|jgi:uncharacterized membrane protein|nr:hypothetical protein [archaeon]